MKVRLHVVIDKEDEIVENEVKSELLALCPNLSFSPSREQPILNGCLEWYATADLTDNEIDSLLEKLNNDFDGERFDCSAYGFNTKMFHHNVYYLQFQIQ